MTEVVEKAPIPRPQAGPQEKACRAKFVDELFFGGARGGGKTFYLLLDFLQDVEQGSPWKGILFRRTYPELEEVEYLSREMFPAAYPGAEYKVGSKTWHFPSGATLKLRHIEQETDADHYQGQSYSIILFDELPNWPNLKAYQRLKACLRSVGARHLRIRSTGNPGGVGHQAVKRYFIDVADEGHLYRDSDSGLSRMFIKSQVYDNKILLDNDPRYIQRLHEVGDAELVRAWLEGDWDAIVGAYFASWNPKNIAVPSFQIPSHWPLFGGMDYGEAAHTAFALYTSDYDGNVYQICEYYRDNASASQHAEGINILIASCPFTDGRRPQQIYADPSMWVKRRLHEVVNHSPADVFEENGLYLSKANNDRITGWRVINDALIKQKFYAFMGWNDNLFRTMPALPRAKNNPEDLDTQAEDHMADCVRYTMMHIYKPYKAPPPRNTNPKLGSNVIKSMMPKNRRFTTHGML